MLIFWRIRFEGNGQGYLVFRDDLSGPIGIFHDDGTQVINETVEYTTEDVEPSPLIGVAAPEWASILNA